MNKSFLSVSPSEGNGNAQVVINVKENMSLDERSESLRIRTSNGDSRLVQWIYYLSRDWEVLVCL